LDAAELIELFGWTEAEFLRRTEGSAIRRIGHECWLRNIAVALGNALASTPRKSGEYGRLVTALEKRKRDHSELVREHVAWALSRRNRA
jgi:epoxyqueuosine reductase